MVGREREGGIIVEEMRESLEEREDGECGEREGGIMVKGGGCKERKEGGREAYPPLPPAYLLSPAPQLPWRTSSTADHSTEPATEET